MRSDMKDVIIDTGRNAGYGKINNLSDDESRTYDGMRPAGERKVQSDRLTPLWRYLNKNCGRRWDDVWSEICKANDYRNIRGYHLRDHVLARVELNCYRHKDGKVTDSRGRDLRIYSYLYYVDQFGILGKFPDPLRYRVRDGKKDEDKLNINGKLYHKINGCWFQVEISERYVTDTYTYTLLNEVRRYTKQHLVTEYVKKRQLSSKELKKLELRNG